MTKREFPSGVAADTKGNIYVVNTGQNQVMKIPVPLTNSPAARQRAKGAVVVRPSQPRNTIRLTAILILLNACVY
jgi:hypothetical protein